MSSAEIIAELARLTPTELSEVHAKVEELARGERSVAVSMIGRHPALGIWKNRSDLPEDSLEASQMLRSRMMQRASR